MLVWTAEEPAPCISPQQWPSHLCCSGSWQSFQNLRFLTIESLLPFFCLIPSSFPSQSSAPGLPSLMPLQSLDFFNSRGKHLYFTTNLPLPRPLLFPTPKCSPIQHLQLLSFPKSSQTLSTYRPSLSSSFLMYSRFTWNLICFAWKNVFLPVGYLWRKPHYIYPNFCNNFCILGKFLSFKNIY